MRVTVFCSLTLYSPSPHFLSSEPGALLSWYAAKVQPRLDQVIFWLEGGRIIVQVDYFDGLGKLRKELFHRPTLSPEQALEQVALELLDRGIGGKARVCKKQGNSLTPMPKLQQQFLSILQDI